MPLREYQGFVDFIGKFSHNPILGIGVGIVMTVLIQSSSATIGILIAMASQGLIPLEGAIPVLLGDNIGTCITAIMRPGVQCYGKTCCISACVVQSDWQHPFRDLYGIVHKTCFGSITCS